MYWNNSRGVATVQCIYASVKANNNNIHNIHIRTGREADILTVHCWGIEPQTFDMVGALTILLSYGRLDIKYKEFNCLEI